MKLSGGKPFCRKVLPPNPPSKDLFYNNIVLYEKFWKMEPQGKNFFQELQPLGAKRPRLTAAANKGFPLSHFLFKTNLAHFRLETRLSPETISNCSREMHKSI